MLFVMAVLRNTGLHCGQNTEFFFNIVRYCVCIYIYIYTVKLTTCVHLFVPVAGCLSLSRTLVCLCWNTWCFNYKSQMRQFLCSKNFVRRLDQQRHNFQTMKQMNAKYADNTNKKKKQRIPLPCSFVSLNFFVHFRNK